MMINYDPLAAEYAQHRKGNSEVIRRLINRGRVTSATRVLEVGCGTGNYISALQKPTGCMAYGCDPSPAMLAQAKQSYPAVNFREGRGELIPFADETFDLVFSIDVIHHIEDHLRYFNEAKRVLASDGRICTVTETSYQIRRRRPFAIYFPETLSVDLNRYPRISQLKRWMQAAGFTRIRSEIARMQYNREDIQDFRDRAYSCLHLISQESFHRGLEKMERDAVNGPIVFCSQYLILWGKKAQGRTK